MNRIEQQGREPTIEELRQHAAETRLRLAEDVNALTYKLSPGNLKEEAKGALRDRANRATEDVRRSATRAGQSTREFGEQLAVTARHNPIPTVMVGAGVGWLLYSLVDRRLNSRRSEQRVQPRRLHEGRAESRWDEPQWDEAQWNEAQWNEPQWVEPHWTESRSERGASRGPAASPHARELKREAMAWRSPRVDAERWKGAYERNPMLIGAAVLGAGLAVAWLLPHTRKEDEWSSQSKHRLAGAKDKLIQAAKDQARGVKEQVKEAAQTSSSGTTAASRPVSEREPRSGSLVSFPPT